MSNPILRMRGICKSFGPGIIAADHVDLTLEVGEIHALAGENGAGKTTLMKILIGLEKPQKGEIFVRENLVAIANPNVAMEFGIGMVHQHFMLVDDLTVAENVVLGLEPRTRGLFDREKARNLVRDLSERYDMAVDPDALVGNLGVANKQKVEILKVLSRNADIIILDEPTAVLTPQETKRFFEQLSALRKAGRTILLITHKLSEIKTICDRITILRKGKTVGTFIVSSISEAEISRLMIGGETRAEKSPQTLQSGPVLLSVEGLTFRWKSGKTLLEDINFNLHGGEILGVVGVEGNGQRPLVDILTRRLDGYSGSVSLGGKELRRLTIRSIRNRGLSFIPEDRMKDGVDLSGSIQDNVVALIHDQADFRQGPFLRPKKQRQYAQRLVREYDVQCGALREEIRHLSGGNMQKVVCAREIDACGTVLVADQPTRGVDIGAVRTIHDRMETLRSEGKGILLVSSDLGEIRTLCQRAVVFHQGRIVARIEDLSACSEEELGLYMLGIKKQEDSFVPKEESR